MGSFGDIGLLYAFAVILGGLIAAVFVIGVLRLCWTKRQITKHQTQHDIERAIKAAKRELVNQDELGEGDLFGVRAIENGFYGGVAQSRPNTTVNSPSNSVGRDGNCAPSSSSAGNSSQELSQFQSTSQPTSIRGDASAVNSCLPLEEADSTAMRNYDPSIAVSAYAPDLSTNAKNLGMAHIHSKPISESSTPCEMARTYRAQTYTQWHMLKRRSDARSSVWSTNYVSPLGDIMVHYYTDSSPRGAPGTRCPKSVYIPPAG